jgi:hypothetical protein
MLLQIISPRRGETIYIDALGRMPSLRFEAGLMDSANQVVKASMQWMLQVVENVWPGACPSAKVGRLISKAQGMSIGAGLWTPTFETVTGGDATLTVEAENNGEIYRATVNFLIRGRNPSPEAIIDRLGGDKSPLTLMARHLSGLTQFDHQGMPKVGKRGEVGIMQLCEPAAQSQHRWSWTHNIEAAKALMQRMQGKAKAYLDQHRSNSSYPNDQALSDAGVLLREMIQQYLGAAYWHWNSTQEQWCANPPDNTVETILKRQSPA